MPLKLETFQFVGTTENRDRLFFKKGCWKDGAVFCDFSGRWIGKLRIPSRKWLWIIKFFEAGLSARKIAQQVGLSYPTVRKAVTIIRLAILASIDAEVFLNGEIERVSVDAVPPERSPASVFSRETAW